MKERPILFSGDMVRALLDGRKTETRRLIKPQPTVENDYMRWEPKGHFHEWYRACYGASELPNYCPYGQEGDRLWVRETWRIGAWRCQRDDEEHGHVAIDYQADGYCRREWLPVDPGSRFERYAEQSTQDAIKAGCKLDSHRYNFHWKPGESPCRWRPPRFMPREFSRITREIIYLRAEWLQQETGAWVVAEGFGNLADFIAYWDSINAKRGYPWASNPWVWVIGMSEGVK